ncbi:hypothetical protein [Streptomyces sp. NPDC056452]|uniref:hypothetical protein n=1 Tax=Streptomyces sp. NPDC056452 TaxID=3345821 RepID=UPI00367C8BE1
MGVPVEVDLAKPYVELSYVDAVREPRWRPLLDRVTARSEITRLACDQAGWGFERVGVPDAVLLADVPA